MYSACFMQVLIWFIFSQNLDQMNIKVWLPQQNYVEFRCGAQDKWATVSLTFLICIYFVRCRPFASSFYFLCDKHILWNIMLTYLYKICGPLLQILMSINKSKHQFFKKVVRYSQNFINLTFTLSERHQLLQAYIQEINKKYSEVVLY